MSVPVANATLGLMVAIAALRRRVGLDARTVILPSFTFAATAQSAVWNGLDPMFVDIAPGHWHMDPHALDAALADRRGEVALVIALSSFGVPPPPAVREGWQRSCSDAGVPLLVDSASGYGARAADGLQIGAQGDVEVVSFHAVKPVTAGEGGVVFCRDEDLAEDIARLANFAFDDQHQVMYPNGINAKMSEPAAAIALASLDQLDEALAVRRRLASELLVRLPSGFHPQRDHAYGTCQFVQVAAPDAGMRTWVLKEAERRGIVVRTYYDPLHRMPAFRDCASAGLPVTDALAPRMLSLPMAVDLEEDEIKAIADLVGSAT